MELDLFKDGSSTCFNSLVCQTWIKNINKSEDYFL